MDEIRELQAVLRQVQTAEAARSLSERNCVDLIQALTQRGLISLLYSMDGKEYLTHAHLKRQIMDELLSRGGRSSVVEIQQSVNVDLRHVENAVSEILAHDTSITRFEAQLISKSYLDSLCEEINTQVQEVGQISVAELCRRYDLTTAFLEDTISRRLGSIVQGKMDQGVLFTNAYVQRMHALIRGVLSACTRPVAVQTLLTTYKIQEKLLQSVVNDLVAAKRLDGSLQSRQWVPAVFARDQQASIDRFFSQNKFIAYNVASRMQIPNPKSYLSHRYGNRGIALSTVFASNESLAQLEGAMEDAVRSSTYLSATPLLPPSFSHEDVLDACRHVIASWAKSNASVAAPSGGEHLVISDDDEVVVVPHGLLESCSALVGGHAAAHADRLHRLLIVDSVTSAATPIEDEDEGRKGKGRGKGKESAAAADSDESDDEDSRKKGGKKKEKQIGGREKHVQKKKEKPGAAADKKDGAANEPPTKLRASEITAIVQAELETALSSVVAKGPKVLKESLMRRMLPFARKEFERTAHSVFTSSNKHKVLAAQEAFAQAHSNWQLYRRALEVLKLPPPATLSVERYILKKAGGSLAAVLFAASVVQEDDGEGAAGKARDAAAKKAEVDAAVTRFEDFGAREAVLESIPVRMRPLLQALSQSVAPGKKSVAEFERALSAAVVAAELQIPPPLDKNRERGALHAHRLGWRDQLASCPPEAGIVLLLVLQILLVQTQKIVVPLPWRASSAVIAKLHELGVLDENAHATLLQLHSLAAGGHAEGGGEDDVERTSSATATVPEDLLEKVKELANKK